MIPQSRTVKYLKPVDTGNLKSSIQIYIHIFAPENYETVIKDTKAWKYISRIKFYGGSGMEKNDGKFPSGKKFITCCTMVITTYYLKK